jgi:pimeloyl-ACP methyl ester carboxylesterase
MNAATSGRAGARVRLSHHVIRLDDGHQVGVSVGGRGIPMVFLHGLGLSRRAYLRVLSRIAGLGFLVVAVDTAGHGDTHDLPCDAGELSDRTDLVIRTLDALGIDRAVFAGHSMGGRMTIHLAATAPDRVMAAILFDAAAGASFDTAVSTVVHSPRQILRTISGALSDMYRDPFRMQIAAASRYLRMLTAVAMGRLLPPTGFTGAARAILESGECTPLLRTMRDLHIPTMVLHGDSDAIVPFESACDVADDANATLYRVNDACHSWLITRPRHGADSVRRLLDGALGDVLRQTAEELSIDDWRDIAAWDRTLIAPDAWVRKLNTDDNLLGMDIRERVDMELVRRAERPSTTRRRVAAVGQLLRPRDARTA